MVHQFQPRKVAVLRAGVFAALFVAQGLLSTRAAAPAAAADERLVMTQSGSVRGFRTEGMRAFLGIPYANPPVGGLRWMPPTAVTPWKHVRLATHFGNHCVQSGSYSSQGGSEDCLYLNVITPRDAPSGLPVMFWIHGGGFTSGESDLYDPNRLVPQGVIVVTINYRLGLLGFFAQKALDREAHPLMNYGLMDQQAALQWVHANIAAFGGDPSKVTIAGESAGALSVLSQLASPGASGLFSAAIAESGAYQTTLPSLHTVEKVGDALAAQIGCPDQSTACLRALPATTLVAATPSEEIPAVDGVVLPKAPFEAFHSGRFNHVPVIDGSNHDEFRLFTAEEFDLSSAGPLTEQEYPLVLAFIFGGREPEVAAEYPLSEYPSPDLAFSALMTDWVFSCQTRDTNDALTQWTPTYAYEFSDEKAPEFLLPPVSFPYGATHASELQFLWDEFTHKHMVQLSVREHHLAGLMVGYWTLFTATGNPNGNFLPTWPTYVASQDNLLQFASGPLKLIFKFRHFHRCGFWKTFPPGNIACIESGDCPAGSGSLNAWLRRRRGLH